MAVIAVYTGTFDPITEGHTNLIRRAAGMFDEVIVAVASVTGKTTLFSQQERIELAQLALADTANVRALGFSGLSVDFAAEHGASVIVRGLRSVTDFDYEVQMDGMNRHLAPAIDTIYMTPPEEFRCVSSSLVRQVASLGGNISPFVHPEVERRMLQRFAEQKA